MDAAVFEFARREGVRVVDLKPDYVAEWRACSTDVLDDYACNGGDVIGRLVKAYGDMRTDPWS